MSPVTTILRAEPETGEEHLHLLGRGVLRLVEHDERVVERAAAHVRERSHLDGARRQKLRHDLGVHHLVERVVERAEVGVDLVGEGARQEAEPLTGLDGGPREDDARDLAPLQRLDGLGHREVGLAGAGRADAEDDRVARRWRRRSPSGRASSPGCSCPCSSRSWCRTARRGDPGRCRGSAPWSRPRRGRARAPTAPSSTSSSTRPRARRDVVCGALERDLVAPDQHSHRRVLLFDGARAGDPAGRVAAPWRRRRW